MEKAVLIELERPTGAAYGYSFRSTWSDGRQTVSEHMSYAEATDRMAAMAGRNGLDPEGGGRFYAPDDALLRDDTLQPYADGQGPTFRLRLWDTEETDRMGKARLAYRFEQIAPCGARRTVFSGADFCASPMHAVDSDETAVALLHFLTLQPGDTDAELFDGYTERQWTFAERHAEMVALAVMDRWPEAAE